MDADDAWIHLLQLGVGEAELRRQVAAQVVELALGAAREVAQHRARLGLRQVERDRALVAVEGLEELAVAGAEEMRPDVAADVAAFAQVLHLDYLGAEVGKGDRPPRAG